MTPDPYRSPGPLARLAPPAPWLTALPGDRCVGPPPEPCKRCGNADATFDPCPYAYDIAGDDTPIWLCGSCRYSAAGDI